MCPALAGWIMAVSTWQWDLIMQFRSPTWDPASTSLRSDGLRDSAELAKSLQHKR